jgi:urease accessory protein
MLTLSELLVERLGEVCSAGDELVLPYELRSRSRLRARLASGEEVAIALPRGQILRGGDLLRASDGRVVEVRAAEESVSTVHSADARALLRAAYHLGNRHVALQLGEGWVRYSHDHVLDDLVARLGLAVTVGQAPFEPEAGAYRGGAAHEHSHP